MDRVYSPLSVAQILIEELAPWTAGLSFNLVLDLTPGYALVTAPTVPKPYLIITANQCPLYLADLLCLQPTGVIALGYAFSLKQIGHALAEVAAGIPVYLGPAALDTGLSVRERNVVRLLALGCDNQEIARELAVTEKTVRNTIAAVSSKLGLKNRTELCYYYLGIPPVITGKTPD